MDRIYLDDNPELWMILGQRTADNTGIYKGYLWLNQTTGDIELTEGNAQKVKRYSTGVEIMKQAEETCPMEDIEWIRCPGLGVINETIGVIGILTEEGAITANEDGLKERDFQEKEWTKAFLFPEVDYSESIRMSDCTIHARVYSHTMTFAYLELYGGKNRVIFPLYFVDGVAEVEADFEAPDTLTAHLYSEIGGQRFEFYDPEPEYGAYKTIEIGRDEEYIGVEYVID